MNLVIFPLSVSDTIQFSPCQNVPVESRTAVSVGKDLSPCVLPATRHLPAILCRAGLGTAHLPHVWPLPSHLLCNIPCVGLAVVQPSVDVHSLLKMSPQSLSFLLEKTLLSCKLGKLSYIMVFIPLIVKLQY